MADALSYQHRDCDAAIQADNLAGACPGCGGPVRLSEAEARAKREALILARHRLHVHLQTVADTVARGNIALARMILDDDAMSDLDDIEQLLVALEGSELPGESLPGLRETGE